MSKAAWLIAGAIVVAGALVAGAIVLSDDDPSSEPEASPSAERSEMRDEIREQRIAEARQDLASALKNAATAIEVYFVEHQTYEAATIADLEAEGLLISPQVEVTIVSATGDDYCLAAQHDSINLTYSYESGTGAPGEGGCR